MSETKTQEMAFTNKFQAAVALAQQAKTMTVTNAQEHAVAGTLVESLREQEKALDKEYKEHPAIIEANAIQAAKRALATLLEEARKAAKKAQITWEDEQERLRKAEEERLARAAREQAEAQAQAEQARLRREAEEKAAAALAAEQAGDTVKAEAVLAEAAAVEQEAQQVATAPVIAPTVVLQRTAPKTPNRRMVKKWRVHTKDGKSYTSEDFQKKTIRLSPKDMKEPMRVELFALNSVAVNALVESLGAAAAIPGVLEIWEEAA